MKKPSIVSMVLAGALAISCIGISSGLRVNANAEELSADSSAVSPASVNSVVMSKPEMDPEIGFGMVQYVWRAEQCNYMYISPSGNWNSDFTQISAPQGQAYAVYKEVRVPSAGSVITAGISQKFAKSFYKDSDGDLWESSAASYTGSDTSRYPVSLSIVSGVITTSYTTYSHSGTTDQLVYITGAYAGEMANCPYYKQIASTNEAISFTVGSVTYTILIGLNTISVKASKTVVCNSVSTSLDSYGALSFCFYTP